MHNDVIEETPLHDILQRINILNNEEVAINWLNTESFLLETSSDFPVNLSVSLKENMAIIEVVSQEQGMFWTYGVGKQSDSIIPLCGNGEYILKKQRIKMECDVGKLIKDNDDIIIFTLITRTKIDEQRIRRFIQLRANLLPGEKFKGLSFSEGSENTGLGIAFQNIKLDY